MLMHFVNKVEGWQHIGHKLKSLTKDRLHVSAITVWEITRNVGNPAVKKAAVAALLEVLDAFKVAAFTDHAAALGGSFYSYLARKKLTIGERNSMIAGTAIALDLTTATDNVKVVSTGPRVTC